MRTVQLAELREHLDEYIDAVKNGERVQIDEDGSTIAMLEPNRTIEEIIEQLIDEGVVERGTGELPPDFLTRPLIDLGPGVVDQFLEDRRHDR